MNGQKVMNAQITPQTIRAQVKRIMASEGFVRSRRMQRFLEFVVEETLAGRADQLGEYGIGTAVFDRGPDFEPALDPIVRNDARRLRLKLLVYYRQANSRSSDRVLIDIPKGGYVPVFQPLSHRDDGGTPAPDPVRQHAALPFEAPSAAPEIAPYGRALCMSVAAEPANVAGLERPLLLKSDDRYRIVIRFVPVSEEAETWGANTVFNRAECYQNPRWTN